MDKHTTIQIPVHVRGDVTVTPKIEQLLTVYAIKLLNTPQLKCEPKSLTSFKGIFDKNIDLKSLRRRALKSKYGL